MFYKDTYLIRSLIRYTRKLNFAVNVFLTGLNPVKVTDAVPILADQFKIERCEFGSKLVRMSTT